MRRETVLMSALLFLIVAAVIWIRTSTVKSTYAYVQSERELKGLKAEVQSLRVSWLKQTSPPRLEALAGHLGLGPPALGQTVRAKVASNK